MSARFTVAIAALSIGAGVAEANIEQAQLESWPVSPVPAAPIIVDGGLRLGSSQREADPGFLWLRIAPGDPAAPPLGYRLELAWGAAPSWVLDEGLLEAGAGDHILWPDRPLDPGAPLAFGIRARAIDRAGRVGPASTPLTIHYAGARARPLAPRADHLLFLILCAALAVTARAYRRARCRLQRVRLAAMVALGSLVFMSTSAAMPWLASRSPSGSAPGIECALGEELACASYAVDPEVSAARARRDVTDWIAASRALRLGQMFALFVLVPALIWAVAAPFSRASQAAAALGAGAALFAMVAAAWYDATIPHWLQAQVYWTADIAMLASAAIATAAIALTRRTIRCVHAPVLPLAVAVRLRPSAPTSPRPGSPSARDRTIAPRS